MSLCVAIDSDWTSWLEGAKARHSFEHKLELQSGSLRKPMGNIRSRKAGCQSDGVLLLL